MPFAICNSICFCLKIRIKMVYQAHVFEGIGMGYMSRANEPNLLPEARSLDEQRRFWAFFGASPEVCSLLWDHLSPEETIHRLARPKHLLWALVFLKVEPVLCTLVGCPDEKTFQKWVFVFVDEISYLECNIVSISLVLLITVYTNFF